MSSQLCRGIAIAKTSSRLLLPKSATNKVFTQSLALASSTRKSPSSLFICDGRLLLVSTSQEAQFRLQYAFISTSNKKEDGTSVTTDVAPTTEDPLRTTTPKRTWISYGFDHESEEADRSWANLTFFCTITMCIVFCSFAMAYWPDIKFKDWSQREAYIELARREALGLPLIDPDLVPVEKFELPTEEELGDFEIII